MTWAQSIRQLFIDEAGLDPALVDISFEPPTRDWATPVARPTVNLYLYDIRENLARREMSWESHTENGRRAGLRRRPLSIDLSYMVTCWTSEIEGQHRLLWLVMETLLRHSPLPTEIMHGTLRTLELPVRTKVAQPDGPLENVADFWSGLDNQLRPSISLIATVDLDLNQLLAAPPIMATVVNLGPNRVSKSTTVGNGASRQTVQLGLRLTSPNGAPVIGAAVRVLTTDEERLPKQQGRTALSNEYGRCHLPPLPAGSYRLVIEGEDQTAPYHHPLEVPEVTREATPPDLIREVEVPMP